MVLVNLKKGSYNRLWITLGALAYKDGEATLKEIADLTGMPRSSTEDVLIKILDNQVPGMVLFRQQATFKVESWGYLFTKKSLLNYYQSHCGNG